MVMIKAALFDVDGLMIVGRKHLFSERLSNEYNIPMESIQEFFDGDFRKCSFGQADLKEVIVPYLEKWEWKEGVDALLKLWFESEQTLDPVALGLVESIREKGIKCYIATRQEKYRLDYITNRLGLGEHFDGVFATCNIGFDKWQKEFFDHVCSKLELKPEDILFFDDSEKNINYAKKLGIDARFYEGIKTLNSFNISI